MVLNIKTNTQLDEENAAKQAADAAIAKKAAVDTEVRRSSLVQLVRAKWTQALLAKRSVEVQMMKNLRQHLGQYEVSKLAAIRKMGGSEVFSGITGTKDNHAIAWIEDTLTQGRPFAVEPTPDVELPPDLVAEANAKFVRGAMMEFMSASEQTGTTLDPTTVMRGIQEKLPEIKADIEQELRDVAAEKARDMERAIDDKLVEGKWYQALSESIFDLVVVKNAFIKGPIKRNQRVRVATDTGITVQNKVVDEWSRRSPFDMYPEPDSSGVQDGYLFDHVAYRRKDLSALIGVQGYDDGEIREVLREHATGGLRDWTGIEAQRAELEGKDTTSVYSSDKIDGLEFYGSVPGSVLIEHGMNASQIPDPDIDYDVVIYNIGNHIIKSMVNEDPYGLKPFASAGYDMKPDTFWYKPLPEKIESDNSICNAAARALVNNIGMGSGPQVEINIDRLSPLMKGDVNITPWKKWLTTNKLMQTGKAIEFWQPNMHVQEIIVAYEKFSRVADEHSVPAYAHGDVQVGGAGNTASGLSMLITQAARGIKKVIKNVDDFLTIPSVIGIYNELSIDPKFRDRVGDLNLVAKGSSALVEKEQRAVRMLEFLTATNNPVDVQLTGAEGRGYLLEETAKAHQIDPNKALAGLRKLKTSKGMGMDFIQPAAPGNASPPGGGTPGLGAANLDQAGNPVQGTSNQLFTGKGGAPAAPPGGGF